jgi:high-affinity iron transporter
MAVMGGAPRRWGLLVLAVAVTAVLGGAASGAAAGNLAIDQAGCGTPPPSLPAGPVTLTVANHADAFASVYVIDPAGDVFAEIPSITPGAMLPLATTLGAGTYALRCVFTDGVVRTSPAFTLTGTTTGAVHGYPPLPDLAMAGPVTAYRAWIRAALPTLLAASRRLDADVTGSDLTAARADWLTAHLDYERLGAAYNSFGDFDDALDGLAAGTPEGVTTPGWTGFHAIEYALWHHTTAAQVRPLTRNLVTTVESLVADFPSEEVDPGDVPLRAHEILENSLQFQLTGMADYGSGTTLATMYANTQGTQEVVAVLAPLVAPRDPALLPTIDRSLGAVRTDLRSAPGPFRALPVAARQRLDGDLGALLEQLSVLPNLLAPRTSA